MRKKIVVKWGGSSLQNPGTVQELIALVLGFRKMNYDVVLVHGGGPAINQELTRRGIEWKFIQGQRQTTPEMMDVIEEVLAGKINSLLVTHLQEAGIPAVGLSGAQENTLFCTPASEELQQVGKIEVVATALVKKCLRLKSAPVPVLAPIGIGAQGEKYNINADWAAAKMAVALKAEQLIFLTDQNGILDQNREQVSQATPDLIEHMIQEGVISGGMYTKVMTMISALQAGVQKVRVLNANAASALLQSRPGQDIGTLLVKNSQKKACAEWRAYG